MRSAAASKAIYPYEDPVALVCNEGRQAGRSLNRPLRDEGQIDIYDVVAGTFMEVGLDG